KPAATYSTGSYPISIATGDFDGDGSPDVVIALLNDSSIQLFSNAGAGTFQSLSRIPTCGNPESIAVADLNRDRKDDIAVACGTGGVSAMLGDGANHFRNLAASGLLLGPRSIAAADLNGDGKLDIVTANYDASNTTAMLGNGDGTFGSAVSYSLPGKPFSVVVADLNGDGKPDLAELSPGGSDLAALTGKGDGTFSSPAMFHAGAAPITPWGDRSHVVADFNQDGKPDVVALNGGSSVTLLLGMGDGSFPVSAQTVLTGAGPKSIATGDF